MDFLKKEKIEIILHCGDVSKPETLNEALKDYDGEFHFVFGNMEDREVFAKEKVEKAIFHKGLGVLEKNGKKISFCHFPNTARKLAETQKYDFVFYGHTHQPWEEKIGKCKVINPGNLANLFYRATFAIYDLDKDKLELKILDKLY